MFPAGFNNLCSADLRDAHRFIRDTLKKINNDSHTVGIIPESHTKNLMYLDHLATLKRITEEEGFKVIFLSFDSNLFPENQNAINLISNSGSDIKIYRGEIQNGVISTFENKIDVIINNNDQSNPWPIEWKEISTPIVPTPQIGWFTSKEYPFFLL